MGIELKIGMRVNVKAEIGRFSVISEITTSHSGMTIYILKDGGWFSAQELEPR